MSAIIKEKLEAKNYILNYVPLPKQDDDFDWTICDALKAGVIKAKKRGIKPEVNYKVDYQESQWKIEDQKQDWACVGFATEALLRWHFVKARKLKPDQKLSARFIWMATKETDKLVNYPTTFLEQAGTQTRLALSIARKYGCVLEEDLPMDGSLSDLSLPVFYTKAAQYRIASYHNLGENLANWCHWLDVQGPILARLEVDKTWETAIETKEVLTEYQEKTKPGGHAVCLVGYNDPEKYFIVRNSQGESWGDQGYARVSYEYTQKAFTEAYGVVL